MTRVVIFNGEHGPRRFDFCRIAVLAAGDGKGERTRETIRREARLLDALDTVSTPAPTDADPDARALIAGGGAITINEEDHALLTRYVDQTPWLPRAARGAVDLADWLSASERVDA